MSRRLVLALTVVLTLGAYAVSLFVTGFAACGLFGCSSGGKAVYAPGAAQLGLLVTGLTVLPLALVLLRRAAGGTRAVGAVAAVVAGALLAMFVLGLGPHGCPLGQSRATTGPGAYDAGSATCSGDRHALP